MVRYTALPLPLPLSSYLSGLSVIRFDPFGFDVLLPNANNNANSRPVSTSSFSPSKPGSGGNKGATPSKGVPSAKSTTNNTNNNTNNTSDRTSARGGKKDPFADLVHFPK